MARAGKLDLRAFQQELATRLAAKTAAQVESSRLGVAAAGQQWLIRLAEAGEVIPAPPLAPVPLTKPWFLGVANIRGNLYTVVDFAGFLGHAVAAPHAAIPQEPRDAGGVGGQRRVGDLATPVGHGDGFGAPRGGLQQHAVDGHHLPFPGRVRAVAPRGAYLAICSTGLSRTGARWR